MNYKVASAIYKYYPFIAFGLIILAGIGGFWLYQSSRPSYRSVRRQEPIFGYRGEFDHWAQVKENSLLWPDVGENLRNRPVYFSRIMPDLNASFTFKQWGLDTENASVSLNSYLTITCRSEDFVYWKEKFPLKQKGSRISAKPLEMNFISTPELSPSWIKSKIDNIQESLDFTGGSKDVKLRVNLELIRYTKNTTEIENDVFEMPINLERSTYSVGSDLSKERKFTKTVTEEVRVDPSIWSMIFPALVLIIPLIGLGFVTYQRGEIEESDLARMEKEYWQDEFGEWISRGKMPEKTPEVSVEMNSLEDLVDAAVDMNNRVIYDEEKSTYFIIQEGVLYKYRKEQANS